MVKGQNLPSEFSIWEGCLGIIKYIKIDSDFSDYIRFSLWNISTIRIGVYFEKEDKETGHDCGLYTPSPVYCGRNFWFSESEIKNKELLRSGESIDNLQIFILNNMIETLQKEIL